jgi:hypothetical protein
VAATGDTTQMSPLPQWLRAFFLLNVVQEPEEGAFTR